MGAIFDAGGCSSRHSHAERVQLWRRARVCARVDQSRARIDQRVSSRPSTISYGEQSEISERAGKHSLLQSRPGTVRTSRRRCQRWRATRFASSRGTLRPAPRVARCRRDQCRTTTSPTARCTTPSATPARPSPSPPRCCTTTSRLVPRPSGTSTGLKRSWCLWSARCPATPPRSARSSPRAATAPRTRSRLSLSAPRPSSSCAPPRRCTSSTTPAARFATPARSPARPPSSSRTAPRWQTSPAACVPAVPRTVAHSCASARPTAPCW